MGLGIGIPECGVRGDVSLAIENRKACLKFLIVARLAKVKGYGIRLPTVEHEGEPPSSDFPT
jgi:hypothetical protein